MPSTRAGRKYIVILIIQFILMMMFLVFAIVQRTKANRNQELLIHAQQRAEENEKLALLAQREATKQAEIARKILEECQSKK